MSGKLVYSTDPAQNQRCAKCKELQSECTCPKTPHWDSAQFVIRMRIEKQGRGGKTVTVLDGFPKLEFQLKALTTELKKKCGSGGTHRMDGKEGIIEVQGDKREVARAWLESKGIRVKG